MVKDTFYTDTETYKNYCIIGGVYEKTGVVESVVWSEGPLSKEDRLWLRKLLRRNLVVGFNSNGFDLVIIAAALAGFTVEEIKEIADEIIVDGAKPWEIEEKYGFDIPELDHIDLIETKPGKGSLKLINGRIHGKRMQDLPYPPDAILTESEKEETYRYWKNDLQATKLLFKNLTEQLSLRAEMSKEYGIDLRSKSDAQVAEAVIKKQVSAILGRTPKKPELRSGTTFRYRPPEYLRFENRQLRRMLEKIEDWTFRVQPGTGKVLMPAFLSETPIEIGAGVYRMGIGGLHSSEKCSVHVASERYILRDVDVASYYPNIIINLGLFPKQLGKAFLKVFKGIVSRRLRAKDADKALKKEYEALEKDLQGSNGDTSLRRERLAELKAEWHKHHVANEGGKIMINGTFGKLGSMYSVLFAPDLLLTVTITGQLSLLMLIEWLHKAGIPVVSANTDGIVIKCPRNRVSEMEAIVKEWEAETKFATEATEYQAIYARDVNNYIAVKQGGGTKRKGAYAKSGLEEKKNPTTDICGEAVAEFLEKGTPISKTIRECEDIRKFVTVRTVNGGAIYGVKAIEVERIGKRGQKLKPGIKFDRSEAEYLGKAIRFYYSTESKGAIHYKTNGNKVPKSDGAKPLMLLPKAIPEDLNYRWYINECRQILDEIGYFKVT